jgi:hypothetical protein
MRSVRTRLALLLGAVGTLAATAVAGAAPARAAVGGNCPFTVAWSGDRLCLYEAGTGDVQWTATHVFTGADGHDHVAGESYGVLGSSVFFEVSRNGGRTWTGWQDDGTQSGPGFFDHLYTTDAAYDGPGYWVRTCATPGNGDYVCTSWN